jgi:hypothetical protein
MARAKHRHFRLFRWPPFNDGRLFMVHVVVAILSTWIRLKATWITTKSEEPYRCWSYGRRTCLKAAVCAVHPHTGGLRLSTQQQGASIYVALRKALQLCVPVGWLWARNLPHTDQGGDKVATLGLCIFDPGLAGGSSHLLVTGLKACGQIKASTHERPAAAEKPRKPS